MIDLRSVSRKRIIRSSDRKQNERNARWHQQGSAVVKSGLREETDDADKEEHKEDIRHFPNRRQIALDDIRQDMLFIRKGAVGVKEASTEVN